MLFILLLSFELFVAVAFNEANKEFDLCLPGDGDVALLIMLNAFVELIIEAESRFKELISSERFPIDKFESLEFFTISAPL